ncbi:MAG TPA: hypothetical protein V6C72_09410 [Chroococcales cyanobacterium]
MQPATSNNEKRRTEPGTTVLKRGLTHIESLLDVDEGVEWATEPSTTLFMIDIFYRGVLWWTVFPCVIPIINEQILYMTILIMVLFARLDYKHFKQGSVYVITNKRAILGKFNRKGELRVTDYPLRNLVRTRKTPFTRTIKMKFKGSSGTKWLKFPYVHDPKPAVSLLLTANKSS